ncbi:MAG: VTT domain-containing protein [Burkholderiales bacterium]
MKPNNVARVALALALAAGLLLAFANRGALAGDALHRWLAEAGVWAPLAFIALYAAATVFFVPGSVLTLAAGALFGPVLGTFYSLTGATLGATLAFLVARHLAADWAARRAGGRLKQLIEGVEAEGWRFVAFVRLVPLFPFNLVNYALGLTRIPLLAYTAASFVCMLPGAFAYAYLGYAGRETLAGGEGMIRKGLLALGVLALIAFLPRLIARLRQGPRLSIGELDQKLKSAAAPLVLDVRGAAEFAGELGHIAGARNIPLEELDRRVQELEDYHERPLVLVCRTDRRSVKAAQLLARQGFADIHVVRGGMIAWNQAGLPVER